MKNNHTRRTFLKTMSGAALVTALPHTLSAEPQATRPRAIVFWEPEFPQINGCGVTQDLLKEALSSFEVVFVSEPELRTRLNAESFTLLVMPHGSAFPKKSWPAIFEYLKKGGNWLNLGGSPFMSPVVRTGARWKVETDQSAYHKRLGITQSFPVSGANIHTFKNVDPKLGTISNVRHVYELYVRFSSTSDTPEESGSDGPREAVLTTLAFGLNQHSRPIAAPIVQIDRTLEDFAGGRWMLANFAGTIDATTIRALAERAAESSLQFTVRSNFASYREGETPLFSVELTRIKGQLQEVTNANLTIEVRNQDDQVVTQHQVVLRGDERELKGRVEGTGITQRQPGFYRVRCSVTLSSITQSGNYTITDESGFWIYDASLMRNAKPLTVDEHFFYRDGQVFPVTGATYMASDVHRKFLFDPNPRVWDEDFRKMKEAGVNMVRTGIWTGWKRYMPEPGQVDEAVLRALEAFLLSARKHDIPVIFTFFAFIPETWGGKNAYLDPQAVSAQQAFLSSFAKRFSDLDDLIWDLINEPSFCSPAHLWSCRPNYDEFEKAAWRAWVKERYPYPTDEERATALQQLWRTASDDVFDLPAMTDFESINIHVNRQPFKTKDYRLFAQDMFRRWVGDMTKALRSNGNTRQLITVGQDEGGTNDSPNNQFMADTMDFTCLHNWWANDDLVWDSVVTKSPKKANLVEETGVMFYEKTDGVAWRTEQQASNLLERKMAISMAVDGAGFIEWIWNTNCYMNNENENAIGFHRVDQTAKPELEPFLAIAKFFAKHKSVLRDRELEEVLMVIPHSQMFSPRSFATEATRKCVRALYYHCRAPVRAVSEYKLDSGSLSAKVIVVPAPRILTQTCWDELKRRAKEGATVVISGIIDDDEHNLRIERGSEFGWSSQKAPVSESETLLIGTRSQTVRYEGEKMQRIEKALVKSNETPRVLISKVGSGRFIWSPLPVEVSESLDSTVAYYRFSLAQAGFAPMFRVVPDVSGVLVVPSIFARHVLYTFVSETDLDISLRLFHKESRGSLPVVVKAGRSAFVLLERNTGRLIGSSF